MSQSSKREAAWDAMSEDEQCLAYGRAVLADARHRDKVFPREHNVAEVKYNMRTEYIYGGGKR